MSSSIISSTNSIWFGGADIRVSVQMENSKSESTLQDLERRVAIIEQVIAGAPRNNLAALLGAKGCVCPVGAEATCKGFGCPRREAIIGGAR